MTEIHDMTQAGRCVEPTPGQQWVGHVDRPDMAASYDDFAGGFV
ncbi:MAG: hypothetical protein PVJ55_11440 [Anaerolineae bacterium]|jgi:hypothetical protein